MMKSQYQYLHMSFRILLLFLIIEAIPNMATTLRAEESFQMHGKSSVAEFLQLSSEGPGLRLLVSCPEDSLEAIEEVFAAPALKRVQSVTFQHMELRYETIVNLLRKFHLKDVAYVSLMNIHIKDRNDSQLEPFKTDSLIGLRFVNADVGSRLIECYAGGNLKRLEKAEFITCGLNWKAIKPLKSFHEAAVNLAYLDVSSNPIGVEVLNILVWDRKNTLETFKANECAIGNNKFAWSLFDRRQKNSLSGFPADAVIPDEEKPFHFANLKHLELQNVVTDTAIILDFYRQEVVQNLDVCFGPFYKDENEGMNILERYMAWILLSSFITTLDDAILSQSPWSLSYSRQEGKAEEKELSTHKIYGAVMEIAKTEKAKLRKEFYTKLFGLNIHNRRNNIVFYDFITLRNYLNSVSFRTAENLNLSGAIWTSSAVRHHLNVAALSDLKEVSLIHVNMTQLEIMQLILDYPAINFNVILPDREESGTKTVFQTTLEVWPRIQIKNGRKEFNPLQNVQTEYKPRF